VQTDFGQLTISGLSANQPDGKILLTVRPEDVLLNARGGANVVNAQVKSSVYMGTHTQLQLALGDATWQAHGSASLQVHNGDTIPVQLPQENIWVLPQN